MVMMAKLNGRPLSSMDGDCATSLRKRKRSSKEFVYIAVSTAPIVSVLRQVSANKATFTQGNFCSFASSNNISAGESIELSMEHLLSVRPTGQASAVRRFAASLNRQCPVPPRGGLLLERLQVLARLETHSFSGRDIHFRTRPWVPAN